MKIPLCSLLAAAAGLMAGTTFATNPLVMDQFTADPTARGFYFPATAKSGGMRIGVAVADQPQGPFTPLASYIEGVSGIDPAVLIDRDGSAYV